MTNQDPVQDDSEPTVAAVLEALDDEICRTILAELSEPMTANDLHVSCNIPTSTLYRKLELLSKADLVFERVEVHRDGGRTTHYERDIREVTVTIEDDDTFSVSITGKARHIDERLTELWSDMGDEL